MSEPICRHPNSTNLRHAEPTTCRTVQLRQMKRYSPRLTLLQPSYHHQGHAHVAQLTLKTVDPTAAAVGVLLQHAPDQYTLATTKYVPGHRSPTHTVSSTFVEPPHEQSGHSR
jgi:hypothetical protein